MASDKNPYSRCPETSFWRRAVARSPDVIDPVIAPVFRIGKSDRIATVGSCFAQHISRALQNFGFHYLVTEREPMTPAAVDENFGVFSARFGNIYTIRQLLQLFERAYGLFAPRTTCWVDSRARFRDPFRPQIQAQGFASPEAVNGDRAAHLAAVREMFESCGVLIFTLGLTEGWVHERDGAVVPVVPGAADVEDSEFVFENFPVYGMIDDLVAFIEKLRVVNPRAQVLLTVSPVPLIATFEKRHVLVSTVYSKSALRVVADVVSKKLDGVDYFPSYEIITGPQSRGRYFAEDLRTVTPDGVDAVMEIFARHYLCDCVDVPPPIAAARMVVDLDQISREYETICDEEALDA